MKDTYGHKGGQTPEDFLDTLYQRHFRGAIVRSGASCIMWLIALAAYLSNTIQLNHFAGISLSVLYLIMINPPTLMFFKTIRKVRLYKTASLFMNFLEIIGYTAIIYFSGGIEATYLFLLYAALITYLGVVAPWQFPFVIAAFCSFALTFVLMGVHFGFLPDQRIIPSFDVPLPNQLVILSASIGLLFVIAYISASTGRIIGRSRNQLREQNLSLLEKTASLEAIQGELREAQKEMENRIQERTAELRGAHRIIEKSPVVLFRWKAAEGWPVVMVSPNVSQFGYTAEELLSGAVPYSAMVYAEDLEGVVREVQQYGAEGAVHFEQEYRIVTKDGRVRWIDDRTTVERDHDGKVVHYQGIILDITDRKLAEQQLQQSEERYRSLTENMNDVLWTCDLDLNITYLSPSIEKILGFTIEEQIKLAPADQMPADALNQSVSLLAEELQHDGERAPDRHITLELTFFHKDGSVRCLDTSLSFIRDDKGNPVGLQGLSRDITEYKKADKALWEGEKLFRVITHNSRDVIWMLDMNFQFTYVSPAIEKLLGYPVDEYLARPHSDFILPGSLDILYKTLDEELAAEGDPNRDPYGSRIVETEQMHRNGSRLWVELKMSFMRDADGKPTGILGFSSDITERKHAEETTRKLEAQLIRVQKLESVGTLAGGIAHDFNNLLTGIQGHTSLMMLGLEPSDPNLVRLNHIDELVQSGVGLTGQLLGFARGGRYAVMSTDINEILEKTSGMFGRTKKEITIHRQCRKDLWNVDADRTQIEQVFMNLYVNAWHAMPGGGEISLETDNVILNDQMALSSPPGKYVKITVSDTGIGMDAKTRERIFDPFFTTKGMGRGTGLGLATVYGIIQGHKGMIDVDSEPGQGATFTIYLPASEQEAQKEESTAGTIARGKETVLLVDDEDFVLVVAREMLEYLGYRVHCAGSGEEALAVYMEKRNEIDLVILDMIMPGISGGETFKRLKAINPEIRSLLSSGYSIEGQAREILERGCNGFMQKPFRMEELSRLVRQVLDANVFRR